MTLAYIAGVSETNAPFKRCGPHAGGPHDSERGVGGMKPCARTTRPEDIALRLRERGITPTQQRIDLAAILLARPQHLSAEQLLSLANAEGAAVSKATVYNTLGLFARRGLVREVLVDPSKVFFDSNTSEHYHVYDVQTGELTDMALGDVDLASLADLPAGSTVERVDLVVRVRKPSPPAVD
ncbi:MAG: Fur family transcriptional regulator [Gammaproteobacteria bacterium]